MSHLHFFVHCLLIFSAHFSRKLFVFSFSTFRSRSLEAFMLCLGYRLQVLSAICHLSSFFLFVRLFIHLFWGCSHEQGDPEELHWRAQPKSEPWMVLDAPPPNPSLCCPFCLWPLSCCPVTTLPLSFPARALSITQSELREDWKQAWLSLYPLRRARQISEWVNELMNEWKNEWILCS